MSFSRIASLLTAFAVGGMGSVSAEYQLRFGDEPIVLRSSMPNSSARSIAVGLPGGEAFCFDAALCQFRYAWTVAGPEAPFLDMRALWTGRGGRDIRVLGTRYFAAIDDPPIRLGSAGNIPTEVRFRGYRILEDGPEFQYEIDGVFVTEKIVVAPSGEGLIRSFAIASPDQDVWFFAGDDGNGAITSPNGGFEEGFLRLSADHIVRFEISIQREPAE